MKEHIIPKASKQMIKKDCFQNEVPELMKKYSGNLEYPASYGFGNDFRLKKSINNSIYS